jgi:hypothetical protein
MVMGRFSSRLSRIEEAVIPRRTASVILEDTKDDDLRALVIRGFYEELNDAKARGDKAFAKDLQLCIKHETGQLRKLSHAKKIERTKRVKRIARELEQAPEDGRLPENFGETARRHITEQAQELRFAQRFPDSLERLASGKILELKDGSGKTIAIAKPLRGDHNSQYLRVQMRSSFIPDDSREYLNLDNCEKGEIWRPWFKFCRLVEDIRDGKVEPPAPKPPSPPKPAATEPIAPPRAKPEPRSPDDNGVVVPFPASGMRVSDYQEIMRKERLARMEKDRRPK